MSSSMLSLCLVVFAVNAAQAMDCSWIGSTKAQDTIFYSCPRFPLIKSDESYCCITTDGGFECCDLPSFLLRVVIGPLILIIAVLSFIISCVCCFCCPFCCINKRRNGRVF